MSRILFFIFFLFFLGWIVRRVFRTLGLVVRTMVLQNPAATGASGLIGATGRALTPIATSGSIAVQGEVWKACTNSGIINSGSTVKIVAARPGMILEVREFAGVERESQK